MNRILPGAHIRTPFQEHGGTACTSLDGPDVGVHADADALRLQGGLCTGLEVAPDSAGSLCFVANQC
jgi:hypothetical protein